MATRTVGNDLSIEDWQEVTSNFRGYVWGISCEYPSTRCGDFERLTYNSHTKLVVAYYYSKVYGQTVQQIIGGGVQVFLFWHSLCLERRTDKNYRRRVWRKLKVPPRQSISNASYL